VVPPLFGHAFRKFYGPFSDTVAAVLRHVLHDRLGWMSVEAAVHVHLLALFVLGGAVAFSVIRREHGGRAALVCLVAFLLNPHLIGHCHNNMKDFAVTAWMVIAAFAFHAAQSRGSYPGLALAGLVSGMAMATKINGLLLIPLLVGHAVLFVAVERSRPRVRFAVLGGLVHWAVALASMVLFWPWLWDAPLSRLLRGTRFFQNLWLGPVLYEGRIFNAKELPWEYAITFVVITTPLCLLPFAALGAARVAPALRARRLLPALALAAFLLVMAVATLAPVPRYDGVRHFLPAFPFLACLSGFGLAFVLERPERSGARLLATALVVGVLGCVLYQDVRLHPYQATYFNQLVGGGAGAMGRFELDYWGSSLKEAGRWVNQHAPTGSRVHVVLDLERLARLRPDLTPTAASPDYAIVLARESLAPNPYRDRTPDYAVVADGAVLARVYRLGPR
jgi:hypothetical protein